jgi:hypothetical protein
MEKDPNRPNGRTRICKKCANKYKSEREKTPESIEKSRKRSAKYRSENIEKTNKASRDWRNRNKDTVNPKQKAARDKDLERYRERDRKCFQKPKRKLKHSINQAARRAKKLKATPPWLTDEQKQEIAYFYENRPVGHHVDHIEPLRGKEICGLHVPWNLQYLPSLDNIRAGNRRKKNQS